MSRASFGEVGTGPALHLLVVPLAMHGLQDLRARRKGVVSTERKCTDLHRNRTAQLTGEDAGTLSVRILQLPATAR
jgi:hypothetical protein